MTTLVSPNADCEIEFDILKEYEEFVAKSALWNTALGGQNPTPAQRAQQRLSHYLGLAEESGEVLGVCKKSMCGNWSAEKTREQLVKELGDVLWYLTAVCLDAGIPLGEVIKTNVEKLNDRKKRGTIHGSGSDR